MGIPVPPTPPEYGNDCDLGETCTPQLWADGETPKYIYASFNGLELCPLRSWPPFGNPNGQTFKLTQQLHFPCRWDIILGAWRITYLLSWAPNYQSALSIGDLAGHAYFQATILDANKCFTEFTNDRIVCNVASWSIKGFGHVVWSPGPRKIATDYNFMKHQNTMAEVFPLDEQYQVIKLCNVPRHSNCKFKFDTQYDPYQNELENFPTPWPDFQDQE